MKINTEMRINYSRVITNNRNKRTPKKLCILYRSAFNSP